MSEDGNKEAGQVHEYPLATETAHALGAWLQEQYGTDLASINQAISTLEQANVDNDDLKAIQDSVGRLKSLFHNLRTAGSVIMEPQEGGGKLHFKETLPSDQTIDDLQPGYHARIERDDFDRLHRTLGHLINTPLNFLQLGSLMADDLPENLQPAANQISAPIGKMSRVLREVTSNADGIELSVNDQKKVKITPIPNPTLMR